MTLLKNWKNGKLYDIIIKEKKKGGHNATIPRVQKNRITKALFSSILFAAVTVIVGLPNPKTRDFTVYDAPGARLGIVPVF